MQWLQDSNHSNVDNQNNAKREACRHYRNKRRNVQKVNLLNLKQILRTRISDTSVGASMTLSRVTKLEPTYRRLGRFIWLQTPTACCLGGGIISLSL